MSQAARQISPPPPFPPKPQLACPREAWEPKKVAARLRTPVIPGSRGWRRRGKGEGEKGDSWLRGTGSAANGQTTAGTKMLLPPWRARIPRQEERQRECRSKRLVSFVLPPLRPPTVAASSSNGSSRRSTLLRGRARHCLGVVRVVLTSVQRNQPCTPESGGTDSQLCTTCRRRILSTARFQLSSAGGPSSLGGARGCTLCTFVPVQLPRVSVIVQNGSPGSTHPPWTGMSAAVCSETSPLRGSEGVRERKASTLV